MRAELVGLAVVAAIGCRSHSDPATGAATEQVRRSTSPHDHVQHEREHDGHPDRGFASQTAFYSAAFAHRPAVADLVALGDAMFNDPTLSASGTIACATCHDPAHAFAPSNTRAIQLGGRDGNALGFRAAPSLRYLQTVPRFSEHFHDSDGDDGIDQGAVGGLTWDGRVQTAHEQAQLPLFSPQEMALSSPQELRDRIAAAPYAARLRTTFGDDVLVTASATVTAVTLALEVYQQDPARFYPYDSKYDEVLRGHAKLTPVEARGRDVFDDPTRGNCASCHPDTIRDGAYPAFTDFGYVALAAPRNRELPANADPRFYDLGLCGPLRRDLAERGALCGRFRTPSLRNVTKRHRFFHNGVFTSLDQVLAFYATRDTDPQRWYRSEVFDDVPARYRGNVERGVPFGGVRGGRPRLGTRELSDLRAFLATLEDGYRP
jgi:cytochrome c peroxidase